MKKLDITKIILEEKDIIICIENELKRQGLKPIDNVKINIGTRLVGYFQSQMEESYIKDTIIECKKYK